MVIRITVSDNDFTEYLERFGAILQSSSRNNGNQLFCADRPLTVSFLFKVGRREENQFNISLNKIMSLFNVGEQNCRGRAIYDRNSA